jgi:transposase
MCTRYRALSLRRFRAFNGWPTNSAPRWPSKMKPALGYGLTAARRGAPSAIRHTPQVMSRGPRGGYNVRCTVTAEGRLRFSTHDGKIDAKRYIAFLEQLLNGHSRALMRIVDRAPVHRSKAVRRFVRAHRSQIRVYFLPSNSPELYPDEQVWNHPKSKKIGRRAIKNTSELKRCIHSVRCSLQKTSATVQSFFHLPHTTYAAFACADNC